MSEQETRTAAKYLGCLNNLERISDHAVYLAELAKELHEKQVSFSPQASKELQLCINAMQEAVELTRTALENNDITAAHKVAPLEKVVDAMTKELKMHHIQRVQAGQCTLELGFVYNDSLNNIGRVAGHCANIAVAVLETEDINLRSHNYLNIIDMEEYRTHLADYTEKYIGALQAVETA